MEDVEGGLTFDFEEGAKIGSNCGKPALYSNGPNFVARPDFSASLNSAVNSNLELASDAGKNTAFVKSKSKNTRQTVCRHWLKGLCMKGDACEYLHQYDKSRMPTCRNFLRFGKCNEKDCDFKHINGETKECFMDTRIGTTNHRDTRTGATNHRDTRSVATRPNDRRDFKV